MASHYCTIDGSKLKKEYKWDFAIKIGIADGSAPTMSIFDKMSIFLARNWKWLKSVCKKKIKKIGLSLRLLEIHQFILAQKGTKR